MAAAVEVFKDSMIKADQLAAAEKADQVAKQQKAQRMESLVSEFESKISSLVGVLSSASTEMEATAQSMSSTATQPISKLRMSRPPPKRRAPESKRSPRPPRN